MKINGNTYEISEYSLNNIKKKLDEEIDKKENFRYIKHNAKYVGDRNKFDDNKLNEYKQALDFYDKYYKYIDEYSHVDEFDKLFNYINSEVEKILSMKKNEKEKQEEQLKKERIKALRKELKLLESSTTN